MTKEQFTQKCATEFQSASESITKWCDWADELHEYDSGKADPDTGEVTEGESPIKSAEDFLDEFVERLEVIDFAYGTETATKTLSSGCYFPWEMMQVAKFIWNGGDENHAQAIAYHTGIFEESTDDDEEYRRFKRDMGQNREDEQGEHLLI